MSVTRNSGLNLVGALVPVAISLITVPIYLRVVGPERYGALAIAWLLLGYFGLFDLGLGRATSFRIAGQKSATAEARADTLVAALVVNVGLGLVGGLVLWAAAKYFFTDFFKIEEHVRREILLGIPLLGACVPVATLTGVFVGAMQGRERFLEINSISIVSTIFLQILPLGCAWIYGPDVTILLVGSIAARLLAAIVFGYLCYAEIVRGNRFRIVPSVIRELMKYGGWISVTSIFVPLFYVIDRFFIGATVGAVAVTQYTVPFQLAQRISIIPGSIGDALFPRLSSADSEERAVLCDKASRVILALMTPPVLIGIFLMGPFLNVWVGTRIGHQSAMVGRIVLIGFWSSALALVPFLRLQASGRPDVVSKFEAAELLPYVGMLYLCLKFFGLEGCALAFAARGLADLLLLTWLARERISHWKEILLIYLILIVSVLAAKNWSINEWQWWASCSLLTLFSMAISWHTAPAEFKAKVLNYRYVQYLRVLLGLRSELHNISND